MGLTSFCFEETKTTMMAKLIQLSGDTIKKAALDEWETKLIKSKAGKFVGKENKT